MMKYFSLILTGLLMPTSTAIAETSASTVGDNFFAQFGSISVMLIGFFMLSGLIMAGMGLMKLKAYKDNPQQVPLIQPVSMIIIGGLLTVLLGLLTISGDSTGLDEEVIQPRLERQVGDLYS